MRAADAALVLVSYPCIVKETKAEVDKVSKNGWAKPEGVPLGSTTISRDPGGVPKVSADLEPRVCIQLLQECQIRGMDAHDFQHQD
eukprot:904662-Rhodomonas_salina.3